eukprot:PhF_6_TR27284/c0_g1_i1/m.40082
MSQKLAIQMYIGLLCVALGCVAYSPPLFLVDQFYQNLNSPSCPTSPASGQGSGDFLSARVPLFDKTNPALFTGLLPQGDSLYTTVYGTVSDTLQTAFPPRFVYSLNTSADFPPSLTSYGADYDYSYDNELSQIARKFSGTTRMSIQFDNWPRPPNPKPAQGTAPPDTDVTFGLWIFALKPNVSDAKQKMVILQTGTAPVPGTTTGPVNPLDKNVTNLRLEIVRRADNPLTPQPFENYYMYCLTIVL